MELLPADFIIIGLVTVMSVIGYFCGFSRTMTFFIGCGVAVFAASFSWPMSENFTQTPWMRGAVVLIVTLVVFGQVRLIVKKCVNGLHAKPIDAVLRVLVGAMIGLSLLLGWAYSGRYLEYSCLASGVAEALKWDQEAAEPGIADAHRDLGNSFSKGEKNDAAEAVKWFRKAAEHGDADAQCVLAICYDCGEGVEKDVAEAVKWYRKAAEQGYAKAQDKLGYRYYFGDGVAKDKAEAVKWWRKAAEQGDADAQGNLGLCYVNGNGVQQDDRLAFEWCRKSAENGDEVGQATLAKCYEVGRGVKQSREKAIEWYRKSAKQRNPWAREALKRLGVEE